MPVPVSLIPSSTYAPIGRLDMLVGIDFVDHSVPGLDRQPSAVEHRIARIDREIDDDLPELAGVDFDPAEVGGGKRDQLDIFADQPAQQPVHLEDQVVEHQDAGFDDLPAGEGQQLAGQAAGAASGLDQFVHIGAYGMLVWAGTSCAISAWPIMIVSRLLKSCATPSASRPMLSIFCAWSSCASRCLRSVTSRVLPMKHGLPSRSVAVAFDARTNARNHRAWRRRNGCR